MGGRVLPKGTRVVPSIYLTNRNPRVYDDPHAFRPERFLESAPETFSWIPFGGGIRRCIGASFALLEMKVILRTMLSELEPRLPRGREGASRRVDPQAGDHVGAGSRCERGVGAKVVGAAARASRPGRGVASLRCMR